MVFVCPVCGKETVDDSDELFGEPYIDDGEPLSIPCTPCFEKARKLGFGLALCYAIGAARQQGWPTLTGTSLHDVCHAIVLRDAEIHELMYRLQRFDIDQKKRDETVNEFIHEHTDATFWLTAECPIAGPLIELCS